MPQPHRTQVHVDRPLTNLSVAYRQKAENFISDKVFPLVSVAKQSDSYFIFTKADWLRTDAQKRAPGSESAGSGWDISTDSYFCDVWALHKDVDDQTRKNSDSPINLDRSAARFVTQQLMLRKELEWVSAFFGTGLWTGSTTATDITVGDDWDTVASTPVDDVLTQADSILEKTGEEANTLVVGPDVHRALMSHADILDRIKYTQKGIVTPELLAGVFGVKRYLVARATRNTAAEDVTATYSFLYGNDVLLCHSAPSPGVETPSAGYTFTWNGDVAGINQGQGIEKFRMQHLKSDRVELEMSFDQKLVGADLGVFFSNVVT